VVGGMFFYGGLAGVNLHIRKLTPRSPRRLHTVKCTIKPFPFLGCPCRAWGSSTLGNSPTYPFCAAKGCS
jgi:hypothetical protein